MLDRLDRLTPDSARCWGTLTAGEMLCHLGDASDSVLGHRVPPGQAAEARPRRIYRWLALYAPIRWPKGAETRPGVDPRMEGTKPSDFERDRARVIAGLRELAAAPADRLAPAHSLFGTMTRRDWQRWAYRHVDHHLRQFGL